SSPGKEPTKSAAAATRPFASLKPPGTIPCPIGRLLRSTFRRKIRALRFWSRLRWSDLVVGCWLLVAALSERPGPRCSVADGRAEILPALQAVGRRRIEAQRAVPS